MDVDELIRKLGVDVPDQGLIRQALTHSSFLNENPGAAPASNERLEFLGDAVVGVIVAEHLYRSFPDIHEGELTGLRAALVRARSLAGWGRQLRLGELLLLGKGEEAHGGREREVLIASAFEALVAAVFLQRGYEGAKKVLELFLPAAVESVIRRQAAVDAKSQLQHYYQSTRGITPAYHVVEVAGPSHRPVYTVEVLADVLCLARATGRSKRAAEESAAAEALRACIRADERR